MSPPKAGPPPLRRLILPALFVGSLFLVVFLRQPNGPEPPDRWVVTGSTMGTVVTVKIIVPARSTVTQDDIQQLIRRAVDDVDHTMSTYRPDSELSRFNRGGTAPVPASDAMIEVIAEAQRVSELSDGAFDITVGPLVDAWGFGPERSTDEPRDDEIEALLAERGFSLVEVDTGQRALRKQRAGVRCDLSAIAKGHAVDRVAVGLTAAGLTDFMVEIGGEVRASGRNEDDRPWRIGVEMPSAGRAGVWTTVALVDTAMATSGDYRNFYERDGKRISHTIDPRTGRPITHTLASVTVVHPSCMTADALATALNVLGPEEGRRLVEREGLAALFIVRTGDGSFEDWASDAWGVAVENIHETTDVGLDES